MSLDQASLARAAPFGKDDGGQWSNDRQPASSSSEASSLSPSAVAPGRRRLTPDTGSEDDDDAESEEMGKDDGNGYELQERSGGKSDEDELGRRSDDELRSPRRRRQRRWRRRPLYTAEEERSVVRKFDRKLVIFMAVLYLLSFLDRSNIGNARIAGMDDDLQSVPPRDDWYAWALAAFYIAYIVFEWMSLLWRLIPAHIYVASLVLSWGVIASLQAVAVNYPMLIFLRTLLGIGEAGFTGVPFYLSFFFKRHELAFRTAIFISAAPLATTFASSLAWLILKLAESGPVAPWRLLFLVEGFPSVLVAALAWHIIPDSPQTAPYLTPREKKVARLRLQHEKKACTPHRRDAAHSKPTSAARDALAVFLDPAAWLTATIFFFTNMAYSSMPVFLPTILRSMGHDSLSAQALAAPPYLVAFLIVLATAHASDVMRARAPLLIAHALASAAGYAVLALAESGLAGLGPLEPGSWVRYLAVYPAAVGFFNVVVLTIAWSINNQRGEARQGAGFALLQVVGQCGPLLGTRLYPDRDAPYYTSGMRVCAATMFGVAVLAAVLRVYLGRVNKRWDKEEGGRDGEEGEALVGDTDNLGGSSFRYML
ncbi:Nicotinamide mononucleotide permease [Madurella fahalii]|uniref:Nicotinamide mononucleotide permease n=1 Tax=Madurella fahalii TaxID=1157608 RepID=A0ABQ0GMG1_9PEZI